jgi:RNA polymerase sigma-70 factor (ECF subfamily)
VTKKPDSAAGEDVLWIQAYHESRDTVSLGRLYEKYKQGIYLHCYGLVQNVEDAKDLASDTFIKAFANLDRFDQKALFYPWLYRIAGNLCIDHLRKKKRTRWQQLDENQGFFEDDKEDEKVDKRTKNRIAEAIKKLKQPQRRCFCLFYINKMKYKEITELTGISAEKVRSHIQNGRRRFMILMEEP